MNTRVYKIYRALKALRPISISSDGSQDCVVVEAKKDSILKVARWVHVDGSENATIVEHYVWERSEQYDIYPTVSTIPLLNSFFQFFVKEWEIPRIHLFEYNSHVFTRVHGKIYHAKSMSFSRDFDTNAMCMGYGSEAILSRDYPNLGLFHLYREIDNMLTETYNILLRLRFEEDRGRKLLGGKPLSAILNELESLYEDYNHFYQLYGERYGLEWGFVYTDWLNIAWDTVPKLHRSVKRLFAKAMAYDYALLEEEEKQLKPVPVAHA
ncbi:MAG: hypothetical protein JHC26_11825 [Thermofilum sp.]|jgi:hypothetical protein|uniref:hypothetical protein n=1 Tax=Thermofilum sp. TaxID=1961369 RepID=UPI00258A737A|nr:hypothetical protein [Thermofilum sp.]MCI4409772.1 hypothetical protein [Thermofilum sp.]